MIRLIWLTSSKVTVVKVFFFFFWIKTFLTLRLCDHERGMAAKM